MKQWSNSPSSVFEKKSRSALTIFEHMLIIVIEATMARPKCTRRIHNPPADRCFGPKCEESAGDDAIRLTIDEYEALRLCDLLKMHHHEAADEMNVSRQTIGRILESAREKTARAIIEGLSLIVAGGQYTMISTRAFRCASCNARWEMPFGGGRPQQCPQCNGTNFHREHSEAPSCDTANAGGPGMGRRNRGMNGKGGRPKGCHRRWRGAQA